MPNNQPISHVTLDWSFTPFDFLQGHALPLCEGYAVTFSDGKIEARVEADRWVAEAGIERRIQQEIEVTLSALEMLRQQVLSLSEPSRADVLRDGNRVVYAEMRSTAVATDRMDCQLLDTDGKVVFNSVQARLEQEQAFLARVRLHSRDPLLRGLLQSYKAAQLDPGDELVHLYEIADGLATRFGGEHNARRKLAISEADWKILGRLANNEPVKQGRHRGKMGTALRDATPTELERSRQVARLFIDSYLRVLDQVRLASST